MAETPTGGPFVRKPIRERTAGHSGDHPPESSTLGINPSRVPPILHQGILARATPSDTRRLFRLVRTGRTDTLTHMRFRSRGRGDANDLPKAVGDQVLCLSCGGDVTVRGSLLHRDPGPTHLRAPLSCKSCGWTSKDLEWRGGVERVTFSKEEPPAPSAQ